jgi:predicted nucleic acid-binding protein
VDTNVVSELRKRDRCDPNVARWFDSCPDDEIYISVLTVGEIRRGIESIRRRDIDAAAALDGWLQHVVAEHHDRIIPVDQGIAEEWGRLNVPDPLPVIDGLLAATARALGMTLVTRNTRDVERTGANLLNPFEPER